MLRLKSFLLLLITVLTITVSSAQGREEKREASFNLFVVLKSIPVGERFGVSLHARVEPGWHMYSTTQAPGGPVQTTIGLADSPVFESAGDLVSPIPHKSFDPNFDLETEYYEGDVYFQLPVKSKPGASPGKHELAVKIRYMLCSDRMCLPPQTETLKTEVTLIAPAESSKQPPAGTANATGPARSSGAKPEASQPDKPTGVSSTAVTRPSGPTAGRPAAPAPSTAIPVSTVAYIWFAMAMGGLALLTPCVFPMIPITVSYFTKRPAGTRKRAVWEAFIYSLGIILTFTLLGFGLTFLFGAGGINRLAASPGVNIAIAFIFIAFALSLFGALDIRLPSSWLTALNKQSDRSGGLIGIFLMALTFSLTSFTCTVPFVGTVMVAALHGNWLWSLLGVAAFAAVFSAPFFLLAIFPSLLKSLPKSGGWMDSVKVTMGFLELAAAVKFLSNVDLVFQWELITRPTFIAIWLAIALITALYLLGRFRLPHEAPSQSVGVVRILSAIFFLAISFYLLRGLFGFPLGEIDAFMPPREYGNIQESLPTSEAALTGESKEAAEERLWGRWDIGSLNYENALMLAKAENRPIFIDFTGYTCTNCRWMEANMFPRPEVRDLMKEYVPVRLYTDGPGVIHELNLRFERDRFGTIALPLYALMSPDDQVIATFPGMTRDVREFVDFLKKGLAGRSVGRPPVAS